MENDNLVSVIVPVCNAESYLNECIKSVIAQDYTNWELILVDDGSTDSSYEICARYADEDKRIRVLHHENQGVSYTRNVGMKTARGSFICFIDADDVILPDYISHLHKSMTENNADVVFCGYQLLYEDRFVPKASRIKAGLYSFDDLSHRAVDDGTLSGILFGSVCCAIYRSDLMKGRQVLFDSSVRKNEDGLFNLELLPLTNKIVVSEYAGYIYRQWKSAKKNDCYFILDELNCVSEKIAEKCVSYTQLNKQLKCRELSIIFWNALRIQEVNAPFRKLVQYLKEYLASTELQKMYRELNFSKLNRYKKMLITLLYRKQCVLFVFFVKYIKPVLEKRLKH